uniref:Uncharacterized protein n=1 Tax=Trichogramma kaykai TaxID=54128 RepID=A0ABD2X4N9_9HYME
MLHLAWASWAKIPKVAILAMPRRIRRQQQQQKLKYKAPIWNPGNNEQFHRLTRLYLRAGTRTRANAYIGSSRDTSCISPIKSLRRRHRAPVHRSSIYMRYKASV